MRASGDCPFVALERGSGDCPRVALGAGSCEPPKMAWPSFRADWILVERGFRKPKRDGVDGTWIRACAASSSALPEGNEALGKRNRSLWTCVVFVWPIEASIILYRGGAADRVEPASLGAKSGVLAKSNGRKVASFHLM
jgi:hypothetical protein